MPDEVVLGQVGPAAMLHVVGRSLVVVILRHALAHHGELVDAARADGRSGLAAQDDLLRQLLVVLRVLEGAVVEARHVQDGGHVVVDHGVRGIHAVGDGARGVLAVADVLQEARQLRAYIAVPLVGHLVADAPHHDAGVVAEVAQQVHQVFLRPFIEEEVVAVGHLRALPAVEGFGHQHHAHFVAGFHQFGGRHVVRGADGVATHVLQDAHLAADAGLVGDAAQGAEVVVVAHALEDDAFTVQEEALVGDDLDGADAKTGGVLVLQRVAGLSTTKSCSKPLPS